VRCSRGVVSCGVVRACSFLGRERCLGWCVVVPVTALAGVCLQDVERGAHGGSEAAGFVPQTGLQ